MVFIDIYCCPINTIKYCLKPSYNHIRKSFTVLDSLLLRLVKTILIILGYGKEYLNVFQFVTIKSLFL